MKITEGSYKKSKKFTLLLKQSGFSFFMLNSDLKEYPMFRMKKFTDILKYAAQAVAEKTQAMGFSKMGSPVLLADLSGDKNRHTKRGTAGWASKTHIAIDYKFLMNKNLKFLTQTLYHEWAHRYLFQKDKEIKQHIKDIHAKFIHDKFLEAIDHLDEKGGLEEYVPADEFPYMKIVKKISPHFKYYFESNQDGGQFLIQKMLDSNMYFSEFPKLVGHGVTIYSTLKNEGQTEIYAYHGGGGWVIGKKKDIIKPISQRNEKVISEDEAYKIIENLNGKIRDYYMKNHPPEVPDDLKSSVWKNIFLRIFHSLDIKDKDFIESLKYLSDYVVKQMENFDINAYSQYELSKPYDVFWVSNEYKPEGLSLVTIITRYKVKDYFLKISEQPKRSLEYISSAEGEQFREVIAKVTNMNPETAGIFFGITGYGLSDDDELWVSFLENLEKMPRKYRNQILKI